VDHLSDYPKDLLTDTVSCAYAVQLINQFTIYFFVQGFHDFDPFVPIEVDKYSDKEILTCLSYYNDRKWLQRPQSRTEEGWEEIKFLSGCNPFKVYEFCSTI